MFYIQDIITGQYEMELSIVRTLFHSFIQFASLNQMFLNLKILSVIIFAYNKH